ncbi:MAG TPA: hypothetical protein VK021_10435 [Flavobacteriaceae bacterium]|nr:hypothetical protein [Flavobacteriaceae bacterium]
MRSKTLTVLFSIILVISCQSQNTETPYKVGNSYLYKVTVKDSNSEVIIIDTLKFTIKKKGVIGGIFGMNMAEWTSAKSPDNKQERGINIDKNSVEIQPPAGFDYLENENIVIAGYPSFSAEMLVGSTSESDHFFPKSYGKLAGKELKQHKVVRDSAEVKFKEEMINCKVTAYKNLSLIDEFGQYHLKAFYNNEYGFIRMDYTYPNEKELRFQLVDIESES